MKSFKWLIVQVCAIVFCLGMLSSALFALGLDQNGMALKDRASCPEPLTGVLPQDDEMPCPVLSAWINTPEGSGSALDAYAASQLFGPGPPAWQGQDCSIDSRTMCITYGSRVYPAIPMDPGAASEILAQRSDDASSARPIQTSLVTIGLGLVIIAFVRRRQRHASPGRRNQTLPPAIDPASPKKQGKGKEDKARSMAA